MVESERRERRRAQKVAAYVDFLDASLVDGFLAKFERERLGEMAAKLRLDATGSSTSTRPTSSLSR